MILLLAAGQASLLEHSVLRMRPFIEVKNPGFHLVRGLGESQASIMYDPQRCERLPLEPHCSRPPSRVGLVASDAIAPVYELVHRVITKR